MSENIFRKEVIERRFGKKVIQFPSHIDRIYSHKQAMDNYPVLNSSEAMDFFRVLPLLISKDYLENILFTGSKDKLSKEDYALIDRNFDKLSVLSEFSSDVGVLPECYFVNDKDLNGNKRFLRRVQELNWECEFWQDMSFRGRNEMAVDMCLGGTHYLGVNNSISGGLNAYAKLTSLVDLNNCYLCIDSIESDNVMRQSIAQWKQDGMNGELFSLFEGALTVSRLLKYDGVIFRAPEASQLGGFFGLPQKKFREHRVLSNPNYCKTGIKIKNSNARELYRNVNFKNRFLSSNIFPFSKSGLEERVESFESLNSLNLVQGAYLDVSREILKRV